MNVSYLHMTQLTHMYITSTTCMLHYVHFMLHISGIAMDCPGMSHVPYLTIS